MEMYEEECEQVRSCSWCLIRTNVNHLCAVVNGGLRIYIRASGTSRVRVRRFFFAATKPLGVEVRVIEILLAKQNVFKHGDGLFLNFFLVGFAANRLIKLKLVFSK